MKSSPVLVIAELSANHLGSLDRALEIIHAAKSAGADFVKFQHLKPETISVKGDHPDLTIDGVSPWAGRQLWDLYSEAMMPWEWTAELVAAVKEVGMSWLSTPFDESAVDFLERFDPPMYKIASFEIVDLPLIRHVSATGKPIIISTGMATEREIELAVSEAENGGARDITLLRTNSGYPAPVEQMDLLAIPFMRERWGYPVGLSDHTLGSTAAVVATGLGATVFEKHLTLRRSDGGPDSSFSSEPEELEEYVASIREARISLGEVRFGPSPAEKKNLTFRPSLRAVETIEPGDVFTSENVKSVRPSGGLSPSRFGLVLGAIAKRRLHIGDPITEEDLDL